MDLAIGGIGVDESSALGRNRNVFGVKRVVFPVAEMSVPGRRRLRKRLRSELDAVRDLLSKAELYSCISGAAGKKDDRLFAPGAAVEDDDDGCRAAKSRKVSPFAEAERARESRRDDRERLASRLATMAAVLPDDVVAFLQNRRVGDADSREDDGEIEMDDVQSMKDGALFQLKMLLDKFAPESTPKLLVDKFAPEVSTPKSRGERAPLPASGISCLSQAEHQEAGGRMPPVQEEEEEERINICGGVSRIAIQDIAEEYGELVNDIGVQLLSPLQRKYVDLAEEDRYVDICGDASPVVFPAKTCDSSSPSLSTSSDSDATSSDSDSSSSSPEALPKEHSCCRAGEPVPEPQADPIQSKRNTQPPEPAPAAMHIAEPEKQCTAATVFAVTKSPPAPTVLPKECGALAQPPEQAPETVQIAEPEKLKEKFVAPAATVHPITGSAPPPAVLPNENGTNSQPAPVPAPVAAQIEEPQPQPQEVQTNDLIAMARQERTRRAMAKARQELLEMEKAALRDERIHPRDMELLGIAAFEHVVSTVRNARTAQPQVNDEVDLRVSPGRPSILQQLGVFLKADVGGEEEEDDEDEQPPQLAVASDGEDMDMEIEDGQIL